MRGRFSLIVIAGCVIMLTLSACKTLDASKSKAIEITKTLEASKSKAMEAIQPGRTRPLLVPRGEIEGFMVVTAGPGDDFASLAKTHYGDAGQAWRIEQANDGTRVFPDMDVIVPLPPFSRGGIGKGDYQVVPVLVYHNFSKTESNRMTVSEDSFREQMRYLKDNGYQTLTLNEFYDFLQFKKEIPAKSVLLTFDDGWCSFYEIAYPVLKQMKLPATLFVYEGIIHEDQCLSWKQIGEMARNGVDIQNHTRDHRDLTKLMSGETVEEYFREIEEQFLATHKAITEHIGKEPEYIAYPYGKTNELFVALLKKHDYKLGFTVDRGSSPFFVNHYLVNRSMIYGNYGLEYFRKNLQTKEKFN